MCTSLPARPSLHSSPQSPLPPSGTRMWPVHASERVTMRGSRLAAKGVSPRRLPSQVVAVLFCSEEADQKQLPLEGPLERRTPALQ